MQKIKVEDKEKRILGAAGDTLHKSTLTLFLIPYHHFIQLPRKLKRHLILISNRRI